VEQRADADEAAAEGLKVEGILAVVTPPKEGAEKDIAFVE